MPAHLEVFGLSEQGLDVPAIGLQHGLKVLQGVLVPALPQVEHFDPALEDEAVLALRVDLEQTVDVLFCLVDPLDVQEEYTGVIESLIIGALPLFLEFGVVGGHRLLVHRQALLVRVYQRQQGAQHHLGVSLQRVELADALLHAALQDQGHPVEEAKGRVAAEPLHSLHRCHLHFTNKTSCRTKDLSVLNPTSPASSGSISPGHCSGSWP